MLKNSTGDIALYYELIKREQKLQKKKEYNAEYHKNYKYPKLEARRLYDKEYYKKKCLKKNPNYIKRPYNFVIMDKGEKVDKMKKEEKLITLDFS